MSKQAISPLRRRMIEDMTVRGFTASTQRGYLAAVTDLAVFLGRSPDRAAMSAFCRFASGYPAGSDVPGGAIDES